jgi:esterase/lipase
MNKEKTHIYFVPGLAASPKIFDFIQISPENYELHFLDWLVPESKKESLVSYAQRMCDKIVHTNVILIGVSFGGVVVQEMKTIINPQKTIIISSVKSKYEMPSRMRRSQKIKIHKLFPTKVFANIEKYERYAFGKTMKSRIKIYKKYLTMRDELYLSWAIDTIVNWQREITDPDILHIHGTKDQIFPIKNIHNSVTVDGGTHIMIINKAKNISTILHDIL